jgi:subtilase family serine protease
VKKATSLKNIVKLVLMLALLPCIPAYAAGKYVLYHQVPAAVASAPLSSDVPDSQVLNLAIGLPLRRPEDLRNLLKQLYDRKSSLYHHFLNPDQFAAMYGPTSQDYQTLIDFFQAQGLRVTGTHSNHALLEVSGKAVDVQRIFHVKLHYYFRPDGSRFYAPDQDPSVDLDLPLWHVSGLDDYAVIHANNGGFTPGLAHRGTPNFSGGTASDGGFLSSDYRHAYCSGVTLTGTGQCIGLVELDGFKSSDITLFEQANGFTNPPTVSTVLVDGYNGTPGSGELEVDIDIDAAMDIAPGAATIVSVEGPNSDAGVEAAYASLASPPSGTPLCLQISSSWTGFTGSTQTNLAQSVSQYAAQGQTYFQCSGDGGYYADDPDDVRDAVDITIVGGTELTLTNNGTTYSTESVYCISGKQTSECDGGGILTNEAIPSYQQGLATASNLGSSTNRNAPDVAMSGDGEFLYENGNDGTVNGTSISAPLWAGFMALVNQQADAQGVSSLGFINPILYSIGQGPDYNNDFHDVNDGSTNGKYPAVTGFDLSTGWGTPNGQPLVNDLVGVSATSTPTSTVTAASTPTFTVNATNSHTSTPDPTSTATASATATPSLTASRTPSNTPTNTFTNQMTATPTNTPVHTATSTSTTTATYSVSSTSSPTNTFTSQPTATSTNTLLNTATSTPTVTATQTASGTSSPTNTSTSQSTASFTDTPVNTSTTTSTHTPVPTSTPTTTATRTPTATSTSSRTSTLIATSTFTLTSTTTVTLTPSSTPSPTFSATAPFTVTATPTQPLHTPTETATATASPTPVYTATSTATSTSSVQATPSHTPTPSIGKTPVVYPNPVTGPVPVHLLVPLTSTSNVTVKIYTTAFRLVQEETFQQVSPGEVLTLTLTDKFGNPLADGLYYVVIEAQGKKWITKLLILR